MTQARMHAEELEVGAPLVRRLLEEQFPRLAARPLRRVASFGTDNAIFRLGDDLAVRLPRIGWAVGQVELELEWLPKLAPHLPLRVPQPLALGQPGEGYPWTWGVYRWLPGEMPARAEVAARPELADQLADFVLALRPLDQTGAPRGDDPARELGLLDDSVRRAIASSRDLLDPATLRRISEIWDEGVKLPGWRQEPVWIHGDLHANNLLWDGRRLSAVLDFSALRVDDPASDLMPAWNAFGPAGRARYRAALKPDDTTWRRARARALGKAMQALPYYLHTNPEIVERARYTIGQMVGGE